MFGVRKKNVAALVVLLISGLVFIICGIIFNDVVDLIIRVKLKENLPLRNGSFAFKYWQMPPVPVKFGLYVFHIANPTEIQKGEEAPAVIEKGPYVYQMHIEKTDIRWHDNDTVEYIQPQRFIFDRELSVGPDTDIFLTVNIPYITAATVLQYEFPWLQKIVNNFFLIQGEDAFMNRSVYEIWWGYQDKILEELATILHTFNISSPLLNGKFGFFMNRNNTGDGLYNIFSGTNEQFDNYVHIDRWNTKKNLSIWMSDYANRIQGTDGSMQAPFVNTNSDLSVFDAYLFRTLKLQYSTSSSYLGIRTLRFNVPYSEFATGKENPFNAGFCTPDCIPSGAYNMSVACFYAPIYVSLPHFVGGDPYYWSQVIGLQPNQTLHQPFYDIQAIIGVSMRAARRYQINIRTQNFKHFKKFEHFPVSYLPILWIDGMAELDGDTAAMIKRMIQDPLDALPYIRGAIFGVGGILIIISMALFIYWRKKSAKGLLMPKRLENDEDSRLIGKAIHDYGANDVLRNVLNTRPDDSVDITRHSVPNSHSVDSKRKKEKTVSKNSENSTASKNLENVAVSENSEESAVSKNLEDTAALEDLEKTAVSENLEGTLNEDTFHEQSYYFDTRTSPSPEHPEKYHSVDEA